ncbi:IS66 family insertion sequence element accessory protein TnpB [Streptococcus handemini]|uniref:IS66 family insertion sequence element accessory protein TnpB n=1 Tax=Streptococcus handemini TaxID=3161188 RepID=UPI0038675130
MTIRLSDLGQVYLVCGKTDMRQGIDSLAYLVKCQFELDPFSGQVFRWPQRPIQSSLLGRARLLAAL